MEKMNPSRSLLQGLPMMIIYKSRFLTQAEVWYDNEPDDTRSVDWIHYHRRSRPVPGTKTIFIYTYAIDLTQSREQLLANLNKDTAYKIRRARERDKIVCEVCNPLDPAVMDQFEQMYNAFAAIKGLTPLHRQRTENMAAAGVLDLSVAKNPQGNALLYHANYRDRHRATSMELPSLYRRLADSAERNFIGRANRCLTWSDILRYKEEGLEIFDFGGWYQGTDPAMLKINDFKRGFGGQVLREYQCEQILTLKGRVVLTVAAVLNRAKNAFHAPGRPHTPALPMNPEYNQDPTPNVQHPINA
jgi:hypothetical protein